MTSCDGNLMKFIPIQLESIAANLSNRNIEFYLFHDGQNIAYINKLKKIKYNNINFHDIVVEDVKIYEAIAKYGGNWCGAAYYGLCAHKYLPLDMDRILYIDSGDILIIDDIDDYYFADFEGKSLIATAILFKMEDNKLSVFDKNDLLIKEYLTGIARGIFNSGSYVINLSKMRNKNYNIESYLHLAELIYQARGKVKRTFFGDQGFLSLIFAGDIKYFAYPQITDLLYMPYNFGIWYFDKVEQLNYKVSVVHYIGDNVFKPWKGKYKTFLQNFQNKDELYNFDNLNENQIKYYNIWYKYASLTNDRLDRCKIKCL